MVVFALQIQAALTNVTDLQPVNGVDDSEFGYYIKLKCTACHGVTRKDICFRLEDAPSLDNYICKHCDKRGSVCMRPGHGSPLTKGDSEYSTATLMLFECNGFEPCSFSFSDGWTAKCISTQKIYENLNLGMSKVKNEEDDGSEFKIENVDASFVHVPRHGY